MELVKIGMIIDVGPKFYWTTVHTPAHDLDIKVTDLEILC